VAGLLKSRLAEGGEHEGLGRAVEEGSPELILECADLPGHRWLRAEESPGSLRDRPGLGDRHQGA